MMMFKIEMKMFVCICARQWVNVQRRHLWHCRKESRAGQGMKSELARAHWRRGRWDTKKVGHEGEQEGRKGKQQERQQERSELPLKPG